MHLKIKIEEFRRMSKEHLSNLTNDKFHISLEDFLQKYIYVKGCNPLQKWHASTKIHTHRHIRRQRQTILQKWQFTTCCYIFKVWNIKFTRGNGSIRWQKLGSTHYTRQRKRFYCEQLQFVLCYYIGYGSNRINAYVFSKFGSSG